MSDLLRIYVEFDGKRYTLHLDRQIADEVSGMGYGDVGPFNRSLSDEFRASLFGGEWGAYEVEVPEGDDYWSISFLPRRGVSIERILEYLLPILVHHCGVKHIFVLL